MSKNSLLQKRGAYLMYIGIALLIASIVTLLVWLKPDSQLEPQSAQPVNLNSDVNSINSTANNSVLLDKSVLAADTANPSQASPTKFVTGLESLPASLQDTDVDGEIIIDEQQQLVVTAGLRQLFDYFLSAQGEEDIATVIQRVESYIRHHTPDPAAAQAIAIFGHYVAYLNALPDIEQRYGSFQLQSTQEGNFDLSLVAQRKNDITQLRQQYFDRATIKAFFSADDEYDDYSVAMLNIEDNNIWDAAQKEAARQDYISRMPDNPIKNNLEQQANLQTLIERTDTLKADGASATELFRVRRELFGAPAAARLALVDSEDNDFSQRFQQYQAQKQQMLQQGLSDTETRLQLDTLEQQLFDAAERKRLTGYAQMQQQTLPKP